MVSTITQLQGKMLEQLEKIFITYSSDMTKIAELIQGVTDSVLEFARSLLVEELESYDRFLCKDKCHRPEWNIVKKESTTLLTSLGSIYYHKTLFQNTKTKKYQYLLDQAMGLAPYARMTEDAEANVLTEAVQTSYEKSGEEVSIGKEQVSRETVKNKIHRLEFPKKMGYSEEKKVVNYIYIDADEDHVSLQFREQKGDLIENKRHQKNNGAIVKLIYVYEGMEEETIKGKRHQLKHPYYFCRVCEGEENKKLWDEVYEYMEHTYDLSKVKKIYLNADGGSWITAGKRRIAGITYVLDEFHLRKYLQKITRNLPKEKEELEKELIQMIRKKTKKEFEEKIREIKEKVDSESGKRRIEEGAKYLLGNWSAARIRLLRKEGVIGSSTESHVSHVLSERMSSRPMGWSNVGMANMAELRAYYYNGGDMLELVRYQKRVQKEEKEEMIYSSNKMWVEERKRQKELGCLADMKTYSIANAQIRKMLNCKHQICG